MDVLVAGGHGKIGLRLLVLLAREGHCARGLIRDPNQAAELEAAGAQAVIGDLERDDVSAQAAGADAIVFAAGAGPGSGAERKRTVDLGGAVRLIEAAHTSDVRRYVIVSSFGAADPASGAVAMRPYVEAKAEADAALEASGLDFTIVRPGRLTDGPGGGLVAAAPARGRGGEIPRDDVAATLLEVLLADNTIGKSFELLEGDVPIAEAVRAL